MIFCAFTIKTSQMTQPMYLSDKLTTSITPQKIHIGSNTGLTALNASYITKIVIKYKYNKLAQKA